MRFEWTELAAVAASNGEHGHARVLARRAVLVFLVLAAQYESWSSCPWRSSLVVPMCLLCSIAGVRMANMEPSISSLRSASSCWWWSACLQERDLDRGVRESLAAEAKASPCAGRPRSRHARCAALRPIIMTSFAFILGVVPLMSSLRVPGDGDEAHARHRRLREGCSASPLLRHLPHPGLLQRHPVVERLPRGCGSLLGRQEVTTSQRPGGGESHVPVPTPAPV